VAAMIIGPRIQALVLVLISVLRTGHLDVGRPVLYVIYGYDIMARLHRLHDHPERDGPKGTLVVALYNRTPGYVACRFADQGATLLCEAFVGIYPPKPGQVPSISATTEEGLKKAGYWRDASGRALFRYELEPDGSDWGGAAVTILNPLIDVFGAWWGSKIDIIAPLAPERDQAAIKRESERPY
jgi:hypothetical protein